MIKYPYYYCKELKGMIDIINKNEVIIRYRSGESKRSISKSLGISRNTVARYIKQYDELEAKLSEAVDKTVIAAIQDEICSAPKRKVVNVKKKAFTPEVERRFYELIAIDEKRKEVLGTNKQTLSAAGLTRRLNSEGYKVSESTILIYFNAYKNAHPECYIKQWYDYGKRAEYDFHQIKVSIAGEVKVYHQVTISLPKSNYVFGLLYKNENIKTVMDSIIKFISFCGGVFEEMVFDNMSTVVKRIIKPNDKEYTDDIIRLSTYYGFKITTCNPRSGNEKGHVENSGKLVRKELFSLDYEFESEEALYEYYNKRLALYNKDALKEFEIEKKALKPKPAHDYLICDFAKCSVSSYSLVTIGNNFYSVPDKYVGKEVIANIFSDRVVLFDKDHQIASHIKKEGFQEYSIEISHYLNTFLKKPGALKNSLALKQAPDTLKHIFCEDYSMDAKKFIEDLIKNDLKVSSINTHKPIDIIADTSENQLNDISKLFGQGDLNERDNTISTGASSSLY